MVSTGRLYRARVSPLDVIRSKADRPITVLQVVPRLDAGGAERTTIDIARALTAAGLKALVASEGGRLEGELSRAGGELRRMSLDTKHPLKLLANSRALAKLIAEESIAIVHARSRAPAWSALFAARRARVPFVTTYHGIYNAENPLKRWYNSVMLRGDAVIANSQWTAQHILGVCRFRPKQLVVIPRGIDLSEFNPAKIDDLKVQRQREQWGARAGQRVILLPGRLTRWKGQRVFIDAVSQLPGSLREKVRAVIAGDAQGRHEYLRELQQAIKRADMQDFVSILPHVSNMALAYAAADIVVSASTDPEAFGRIPPEAAAMGRPVIATDHGGARETVLAGVSGLLTPPADASALAAALGDLLTRSQAELEEMGRKGRAHVVANYSVERMQNETLKLYRTMLDRSVVPEPAAD